MNYYEQELQELKPWDKVQGTEIDERTGFNFIYTAGHGYLVIPVSAGAPAYEKALELCSYGFKGTFAIYLEEDCEAPEFAKWLDHVLK